MIGVCAGRATILNRATDLKHAWAWTQRVPHCRQHNQTENEPNRNEMWSATRRTDMRDSADKFIGFLNRAVTPFHAVQEIVDRLKDAEFEELREEETWALQPLRKYFITKNRSTILAFVIGGKFRPGNGFSIVAAHTDSPSLRVKPISKIQNEKFLQVGVATYGGGIWRSWFDRDLSVAGQIIFRENEKIVHRLINIDRPILYIPNLAIHLCSTNERNTFELNNESNLRPILATCATENLNKSAKGKEKEKECSPVQQPYSMTITNDHHSLLIEAISSAAGCKPENILDMDLYLYDNQKAAIGGLNDEFISGQRLDNLVGAYTCMAGLMESLENMSELENDENVRLAVCYDNEECGSGSAQGAMSAFTECVLRRISAGGHQMAFEEAVAKSLIISADQAHAVHPNYRGKHEECHRPEFHGGVVVKINPNQRYATTPSTHSILKEVAMAANVPLQKVVTRNDVPCGSTVGPILAARLGIQTIDVGCSQLAMHSIRELTCTSSIFHATRLFASFYRCLPQLLKNVVYEQ